MSKHTRMYPTDCTSAYCGTGGDACATCEHNAVRVEFLAWVERTDAHRPDPIWSPSFWTARREEVTT